jgi:hypothetical protein
MKPSEALELAKHLREISVEEAAEKLRGFVKQKESKKDFVPPTLGEVVKFFSDNGYTAEHAKHVYLYYEDAVPPWTDSKGQPVRGWRQKMRGNWMKNEGKIVHLTESKPSVLQANKEIFR